MTIQKKLYKAGEGVVSMLKYPGIVKKVTLGYESRINALELKKAENISTLGDLQLRIAKGDVSSIDRELEVALLNYEIETQIEELKKRMAELSKKAEKEPKESDDDEE